MRPIAALLFCAVVAFAQTITSAEYYWDTDPGLGFGTAFSLTSADSVAPSAVLPSPSESGLHTLFVRYQDSTGRWSRSQGRHLYFEPLPNPVMLDSIDHVTIRLDATPIRSVGLSPEDTAQYVESLETDTIAHGLRKVSALFTTESGRQSPGQGSYLYVFPPDTGYWNLKIVNADMRLNDIAIGTIDLPDSSQSGHGTTLATDSLPAGMHKLGMDFRDERGITTGNLDGYFYLFEPHMADAPLSLTAAEYYINIDPGTGSAVQLLPEDGVFDEMGESFSDSLVGLPLGLYVVGLRVRDSRGIWSEAQIDSFLIAPMLTITPSGNDIVLRWQPGENGGAIMHVERALFTDGPFGEIATTTDPTYTDTGILTTHDKAFYRVRQDLSLLANFRLPEFPPGPPGEQRGVK